MQDRDKMNDNYATDNRLWLIGHVCAHEAQRDGPIEIISMSSPMVFKTKW